MLRVCYELAGIVGVDPARLTLRKLAWMAAGRKRVDGQLFAWHLAGVVGFMPLTGKVLDPERINPFGTGAGGTAEGRREIDRVRDFISARGIAALGGIGGN
ncbi:unnamed protein product [Gemmata massiliana]|uniref:Uncharacterized protein n=1 Tax=Gemmata massiliana TaxID=1210884 RepID=A0A6P2CV29_9BACT|nr:hypothetical protein [Gemmata massiliana]VTR92819.1 unnamed protein product [Gemmata massiliana]